MTAKTFLKLLDRWQSGQIEADEATEFIIAVRSGIFDDLLAETIGHDLQGNLLIGGSVKDNKEADWQLLHEKISKVRPLVIAHRVHFLRTAWFRAAVAILIVLTGYFVYYKFSNHTSIEPRSAKVDHPADILPGTNKATLTLSDGRKIELTNTPETITDGKQQIKNVAGQLVYEPGLAPGETERALSGERSEAGTAREGHIPGGVLNTMTTPRGGQYQLVLPDGSRVWLNAASSITYPITFSGKTREVKITGEAYFEIKPSPTQPFIVKTISDEIQVLGTSFNINAYNDAPVKTSLLEGKVKINASILKPGQAYINGKITATNIEQDLAWKNGVFAFHKADIKTVMRQLSRWYDVDVQYSGTISNDYFTGEIGRNLTLTEVLDLLSQAKIIYTIKNKTITILPEKNK